MFQIPWRKIMTNLINEWTRVFVEQPRVCWAHFSSAETQNVGKHKLWHQDVLVLVNPILDSQFSITSFICVSVIGYPLGGLETYGWITYSLYYKTKWIAFYNTPPLPPCAKFSYVSDLKRIGFIIFFPHLFGRFFWDLIVKSPGLLL